MTVRTQLIESQACLPVAEFWRLDGPFDTVLSQSTVSKKAAPRKALLINTLRGAVTSEAERTGFEPAEGCDPFTDLANRRFRPLSHLSECVLRPPPKCDALFFTRPATATLGNFTRPSASRKRPIKIRYRNS